MTRDAAAMARRGEAGQALVLAMGGSFALIATTLALVAIAGAMTGKGRLQRAADLVAISAARSMRDDLPRLLAPSRLPDGGLDPRHLDPGAYLARARVAALAAAKANGVARSNLRISFPDEGSFAPVRVKVVVAAAVEVGDEEARTEASAVAEAAAPSGSMDVAPKTASGGGYSGPLVYRQGEPTP